MTDFEKKMHHDGRLYGWAMLIAICAFPFFASVRSGIWPDFKIIWPGVLTMWILMASYVLSEMIAFPPILGPGSLYLTYITGNLQNQKIPCALSAMSIAGIEAGSEKANAVSVVAVAVSSITRTRNKENAFALAWKAAQTQFVAMLGKIVASFAMALLLFKQIFLNN